MAEPDKKTDVTPEADEGNTDLLAGPVFPDIGPEDDGTDDGKKPAADPNHELTEKFGVLQGKFDSLSDELTKANEREDRLTAMTQQLMAGTQTPAAPAPVAAPVEEKMPDPLTHPEDFRRAVEDRAVAKADAHIAAREAETAATSAAATAQNQLWDTFRQDYPELAKRPALIRGAASLHYNGLSAQGLDPNRLMSSAPADFVRDVHERAVAELGYDPDKGEKPPTVKEKEAAAREEEAKRTGGLPPGGANAAAINPNKAEDGGSSLIGELKKRQTASGFY